MFQVKRRKLLLTENFKTNICNPCLVKVPDWCKNKLADYYLFYADHKGKFIKLAYSNNLFSKWKIKKGGVIHIRQFNDAINHIASPEIYIDSKKKEVILFTHSHSKSQVGQWTYISKSKDALNFEVVNNIPIAPFYFRMFQYNEYYYALTKGGALWKSKNFSQKFSQCQNLFYRDKSNDKLHNYDGAVRHLCVIIESNSLIVFYTKIGDKPEKIYFSKLNLKLDEKKWFFKKEFELMRPEKNFEGKDIKLTKSMPGDTLKPENALRDPHVLKILNNYFLTYCVKGEFGIAIAELIKN